MQVDIEAVDVTSDFAPDPTLEAVLENYSGVVEGKMNEELGELSPPAPGSRHSTIESNPPPSLAQPPASASLSFRSEAEQFHLVGFEPAYGNYRRHTPQVSCH